jgi:hypothetical protein
MLDGEDRQFATLSRKIHEVLRKCEMLTRERICNLHVSFQARHTVAQQEHHKAGMA